jgi:Methyltransferase domain
MSFIDLFSDKSDLYAAARPHYPESLYAFLASCVNSRTRAWDCGASNGQSSISLVEYFAEVYATDASEQQIANAIQKKCVFYSVQPAEETNFANDYFDIVTVAQALRWFDLDLFWVEVGFYPNTLLPQRITDPACCMNQSLLTFLLQLQPQIADIDLNNI